MSHFRQPAPVWGGFALATLLWTAVTESSSIPMNYCSSINTASMAANHSIYQSDGLCHDFCNPSYALAIVQGDSCWCSNLVPDSSTQVSIDECSNPCPGFPSDVCGGDGLYGYMLLSDAPSGTVATGQPASTASSTVQTTVTSTPNSSTLTASRSSSGSSSGSSSLSSGMTTLAPTVQTVTAGGTVRTVTVTPTVAIGSASSDGVSSSSSGLSTGAAVGVAVGIVALVAILAGIGIFFFLRRRREREADSGFDVPSARGSSAGMMNTPKTDMSESRYAVGPDGRSMPENWESDGQGRRRSKLMPVDPRMDPFGTGIYARPENKSHDSIHSLRDDQDYSRRVHEPPKILRATNPDPEHDD